MSRGTCPCCEERVVFHPGYNDLLTVVPDAALDIRAEDNPEINIHAIPLYWQQGINWHCHVCGFSWSTISTTARLNKMMMVHMFFAHVLSVPVYEEP